MLDALSTLHHRLFPNTAARAAQRRQAGEPRLLNLRNLPGDTPGSTPLLPTRASTSSGAAGPDPLQRFALAPEHGQALAALLQQHRRLLDPDYYMPFAVPERAALDSFFGKRAQLVDAALDPTAQLGPPSRHWPDLVPVRSQAELLKQLLGSHKGLVVGEVPTAQGGRRLLVEHMLLLRRLGVDTLYLEHLQGDIHQMDLDHLHRTGTLSPALARFLAEQDSAPAPHASAGATLRSLVDAAFKVGMRVVALDLMASYHLRGVHDQDGVSAADRPDIRVKLMDHVAAARIVHDQRRQVDKPGPQRWVALVGNAHAGTFNGIPGLAERLGVPSLRVEDASPSWSRRLQVGCDPGRTVPPALRRAGGELQCDYLLKLPAADGRVRPDTPAPCTAGEALRLRELRNASAQGTNAGGRCDCVTGAGVATLRR